MVKIVTGKINSCKSTKLKKYYDDSLKGDGFIAEKHMQGNFVQHYDLIHLSTGQRIPYIVRNDFYDGKEEIIYQKGPYLFYKSAFDTVEKMVDEFICKNISPIYLDEISLLELEDKGFHKVLKKCLASNMNLCLVVREDLIDKVLNKYQIRKFEFIGD